MANFDDRIELKVALLKARSVGLSEEDIRRTVDQALGPVQPEAAPRRRSLTFSEWKAERAAREGAGGAVELRAVGPDGRPTKDRPPTWGDYIEAERASGKLPRMDVIRRARAAGTPIRNYTDYKRMKVEGGAGPEEAA